MSCQPITIIWIGILLLARQRGKHDSGTDEKASGTG